MKKIIVLLMLMTVVIGMISCTSEASTFEKQIEEVKAADIVEEEEHPNSIEATLVVQCDSKWLPYYKKIRAIVEVEYPDSTIEILVDESVDHLNKVMKLPSDNSEVADVYIIPYDKFDEFYNQGKIGEINSDFIASAIGADVNKSEYKYFFRDNTFYGFPVGLESVIAYVNEINSGNEGVNIEGSISINSLEQNNAIVPIYEKEVAQLILPQWDFEFLTTNAEGVLTTDFSTDYDDLTPEMQTLFSATYDYWRLYNETDVWNPGVVRKTMFDMFKTGSKNTLLIGSSDHRKLSRDISEYSGITTVPLGQLTFANKQLSTIQNGWGIVTNSRIDGDENKKLLSEVFVSELLSPINASEYYLYTNFIMPHAIEKDFESLDSLTISTINTVLESYSKLADFDSKTYNDVTYDLWKQSVLSWEVEDPDDAEEAYEILQEAFLSVIDQGGSDD